MKFNPDIHFLGKLCKHGHEFEDSGLSLRYKTKGKDCKICVSNIGKRRRLKNGNPGHPFKDITGQRFGRLAVVERVRRATKINDKSVYWKCLCDCGAKKIIRGAHLRSGQTKSCGCLRQDRMEDRTGLKQGRLTFLKLTGQKNSSGNLIWLCQCDCGATTEIVYKKGTMSCRSCRQQCRSLPPEAYILTPYKRVSMYLTDGFVRGTLTKKNNLKSKDIPQPLVDLQREVIRNKRLLKEM